MAAWKRWRGLLVADLPDQDDVGVLAQHRAQDRGKPSPASPGPAPGDPSAVFDGVLDGDYVDVLGPELLMRE